MLKAGPLGAKGRLQDKKLNKILVSMRRAGKIDRQETCSMLPVIVMSIEPQHFVLDLCAAPGSKTTQVLERMHDGLGVHVAEPPVGIVVANDIKSRRLQCIVERARRLPAGPLITTCCDAKRYPNLWRADGKVRFDRVLCDVPCSGDGTIRKARGLLDNWTPRAGLCHHGEQLGILRRGLEFLTSGGLLTYSTCALNPVECEAVVAAALVIVGDSYELLPIDVPGLPLQPGLSTWRVPAPAALPDDPVGGVTYSTWAEVPPSDKASHRLRRSMFPPDAGASPEAARIKGQLRLCGRLLPTHDDGGCFFLAVFRRRADVEPMLSRGDRVVVQSTGLEAIVRGPGTGKFTSLLRIAHLEDGSMCHLPRHDLRRVKRVDATRTGDKAADVSNHHMAPPDYFAAVEPEDSEVKPSSRLPLLSPARDDDWRELQAFYGLVSDPIEAAAKQVQAFPKDALVYGINPTIESPSEEDRVLCLASLGLRALLRVQCARLAMRTVFCRSSSAACGEYVDPDISVEKSPEDEASSTSAPKYWLPSAEAAPLLAKCCTRRVVTLPPDVMLALMSWQFVDATLAGIESSWPDGPVVGVAEPSSDKQVRAVLCTLSRGQLHLVRQGGFNVRASLGIV